MRILVITASRQQLPLIRRARELGLFVVATDREPTAPGLAAADVGEVVDTLDVKAVLDVALRYRPSAVVTEQTDVAVLTAARVAEAMKLRGIGVEVARAATHKYEMRLRCRAAGIASPEFRLCRTFDDAVQAVNEIGLPTILKPVDNQASRGVTKVASLDRLEAAFGSAKLHSRTGEILVEQLMRGTESSVEAFVDGESITTLGICDKTKCSEPYSFDVRLVYPGRFSRGTLEELRRTNEAVIRAIGIRMGITHGEYIVTSSGVRLIEIAARGCGAGVATQLLPAMTGADLLGARLRQALGEPPQLVIRSALCGVLDFIVLPPGRATRVGGLDEARTVPNVVGVDLAVHEGQQWTHVTSGDQRHGYILAVGESIDAALHATQSARKKLQIEVEERTWAA